MLNQNWGNNNLAASFVIHFAEGTLRGYQQLAHYANCTPSACVAFVLLLFRYYTHSSGSDPGFATDYLRQAACQVYGDSAFPLPSLF